MNFVILILPYILTNMFRYVSLFILILPISYVVIILYVLLCDINVIIPFYFEVCRAVLVVALPLKLIIF